MTIASPTDPKQPKKRRSGAPKGNQNARRHGFYSKYFPAVDRKALEASDLNSVKPEIELVRKYLRDYIKLIPKTKSMDDAANQLRTVTIASDAIARLIRTQKIYFKTSVTFEDIVTEALAEVADEIDEANELGLSWGDYCTIMQKDPATGKVISSQENKDPDPDSEPPAPNPEPPGSSVDG